MAEVQVEALADEIPRVKISEDEAGVATNNEGPSSSANLHESAVETSKAETEVDEVKVKLFDLYKTEGNALVKAEKYAEALEKYALAWNQCETEDDRAMILNNRGVVYEKMGDTEKALEIFQEALTVKPEYVKVLVRRSIVYRKLKKYDLAMEDLSEAQVLAMKINQSLTGLADSIGQLITEYAESEIEKLSASRTFGFPKDSYIKTYFRGFYYDPISRMWRGLDSSPLDTNEGQGDAPEKLTGYLAAMACMKSKDFAAVPDHCTTEIETPGGSYRLEALLLRGSFYFLCGDCAGALADFQAIADYPDATNQLKSCAHLKAGLCQNLWGSCEETAVHFSKAEQFWKQNGDVYYHAAVCLVDKGEAIPALALLEKGVEECPDPKSCPLLHVLRLSIQTSYDACVFSNGSAIETMGILREMERNGMFDTPECYELYAQPLLLLSQTEEEALAMFDKAVELADGCKIFQLKRVMASLMRTDDRDVALKTLEAFTDDPDVSSVAYFHIGEIYMMLQKFEEGFAAMEKSIEQSSSIYDAKIRIMSKADFKYNVRVAEKMKLHEVDVFGATDDTNKALE